MVHLFEVYRVAAVAGGMLPCVACCNASRAICLFWTNHLTKIAVIHSYDTSGSTPEYLATICMERGGGVG